MNYPVGTIEACTASSAHCFHPLPTTTTVGSMGWYHQEMVCCYCGKHATFAQGGTVHFHGPHEPNRTY